MFFWKPAGVVPSLADLPVSEKVPSKKDVSIAVSGKSSAQHPLIVAELAGGKIIGDLRLAATADDVVIGGVQTVFGCADLPNHYSLHRRRFRIPKHWNGTALLLGGDNGDNYYHWLMDTLPRWKMLQAANHVEYDYVLLHSRTANFQEEMLDQLKIPAAKRLRCSKNFVHQFDRLVVPSMPYPLRQIAPWVCDWLRSFFPDQRGGPERIYLSRRRARRRRLVNEAELESKLQSLGFISVLPEQMPSVAEQAKMFASAKCVVAPHGAGLTNMVFAPPDALLVELFHPDILRPTYKNLAAARGLRYTALIGEHAGDLSQTDDDDVQFRVNIPDVLQILKENVP
jgi:capsular polysaccharide biosynthesis protein